MSDKTPPQDWVIKRAVTPPAYTIMLLSLPKNTTKAVSSRIANYFCSRNKCVIRISRTLVVEQKKKTLAQLLLSWLASAEIYGQKLSFIMNCGPKVYAAISFPQDLLVLQKRFSSCNIVVNAWHKWVSQRLPFYSIEQLCGKFARAETVKQLAAWVFSKDLRSAAASDGHF